ncbi:unnamed protein product [Rotaria magnacalcarata]
MEDSAFVMPTIYLAENDEEQFCLIRWLDKNSHEIVPQRYINASSTSIVLYETYQIKIDSSERKGTVILKGTRRDCEQLQSNVAPLPYADEKKETESTKNSPTEEFHTTLSAVTDMLADVKEESNNNNNNNNKNEQDDVAIQTAVLMKLLQLVITGNSSKDNDSDSKLEVHNVRCARCGSSSFRSDRCKCLNYDKLNLCAKCFERRKESETHKSGHAFVRFKSPGELFGQSVTNDEVTFANLKELYGNNVHEFVSCDGCKSDTIKGWRFKCDTCPNYDLCMQCLKKQVTTKTDTSDHPLIVTTRLVIQQILVEDIELSGELGTGAFGIGVFFLQNN